MKIQNPIETVVGALVLAVAIGFAVYAAQPRAATAADSGEYQVFALFRAANGVVVGTDVRVAGVKVGRVTDVGLDTASKRARVTMAVTDTLELSDETIAIVDSEGLLGGTFIALDPVPGFETLRNGEQIANTQGSISFSTIIARIAGGSGGGGAAQ